MRSNKIFSEDYHLDHKVFSIILLVCSWFVTNERINLFSGQMPKSKVSKVIYNHVDKELCLELKAYQYPAENNSFEKTKEEKVEGSFYHFDDEKEIIIIETHLPSNEIEVSVRLWKQRDEIKVVLVSCSEYLKSNKKELNKLVDSLI